MPAVARAMNPSQPTRCKTQSKMLRNAKDLSVFPLLLVHCSGRTSEDLKLARGCLPLAPFFKTPQFYGVCCALTPRSNAAAGRGGRPRRMSSPTGQLWTCRLLEPSRLRVRGSRAAAPAPPRRHWQRGLDWKLRLPNHCCLFRGALKPPLFSFGSAVCGSRKFDF